MQSELYNQSSHNQLGAHEITYPALRGALRRLSQRKTDGQLTICDLGCAGGANSVALMRVLLEELRGRLKEPREISLVFEELPSSDFNTLVQTIHREQASLWEPNRVHTSFIGRSFYEPLFPEGSIDLALTYITLHWMSAAPGKYLPSGGEEKRPRPAAAWTFCGEVGTPAEVYAAWREAACADLARFFELRAKELRDGAEGLFLMVGGNHWHQWADGSSAEAARQAAAAAGIALVLPDEIAGAASAAGHTKKALGKSIFTEAMQRAVAGQELRPAVLERAYVPYFLRTRSDVEAALARANERSGVPGGLLELVDLQDASVAIGAGEADGLGAAELGWSIHANSLKATGEATEAEMAAIKRQYMLLHREVFDAERGVLAPYMYVLVRRKPRAQ